MKIYKVAIVGFGVVGKLRANCVKHSPFCEIVVVVDQSFSDPTIASKIRTSYGSEVISDYSQLANYSLDIVFVCLPNYLAGIVTIFGLKNGLHVFCEKPPCKSLRELLEIEEVYRQTKGLVLQYGFNHRHHDSVKKALHLHRSGEYGSLICMRGVYGKSKLITFDQPDWRTKREFAGGGVLLDQGIHMIDLMILFGGNFIEVSSAISNRTWNYDVEDNAYAILKSQEGVLASLHSSATQWDHRFTLELTYDNGSITLEGLLTGSRSYGTETIKLIKVDHDRHMGIPENEIVREFDEDPSWDRELEGFVNKIRKIFPSKSDEDLYASIDDAIESMSLIERIYCADEAWIRKYPV